MSLSTTDYEEVFQISFYDESRYEPLPPCWGDQIPCIRIDRDEIEQFVYKSTKKATWFARFFLKILLWAVRRVKKRVLNQIVREHKKNVDPAYVAPHVDDVQWMIAGTSDGPKLILGRAHEPGAGHHHGDEKKVEAMLPNARANQPAP